MLKKTEKTHKKMKLKNNCHRLYQRTGLQNCSLSIYVSDIKYIFYITKTLFKHIKTDGRFVIDYDCYEIYC